MSSEQTHFKKSTDGIVNHDGSIRVEKNFDVLQEVIFVKNDEIHLQNKAGVRYQAHKHKNLDLTFCEVGDTAFVKFVCGRAYVVGFRKEVE